MSNVPKDDTNKVRVRTWIGRFVENALNRFKTFSTILVDEYSDEWFLAEMKKRNPAGTICESHRDMFRNLKKSYIMAKKMDKKLREYKYRKIDERDVAR